MVKFILALFSDKGTVSMMRLLSLVTCCSAVGIAIVGIQREPVDYAGLSMLCGTFLTVAFGGKVLQKKIESPS